MPRAGLALVTSLALGLSSCGAGLPKSVIKGSNVKIGWTHDLTSTNTASREGATDGNLEVAAMTHGRFARVVDGDVRADKSFGRVKVVDTREDSFTVRYDLEKPSWSDGAPVDAADLMLAWAAGSNALKQDAFTSVPGELAHSKKVPKIDEFDRSIDVTFTRPVAGWHTAIDIAVPAHIVGQRAFDIDDPMEAKQRVIKALRDKDSQAIAAMARVWNDGFDLSNKGVVSPDLLVASGPYRVDRIDRDAKGTKRVRLVANGKYAGRPTPSYQHIELIRASADGQVADLGDRLDIAQVKPTNDNWRHVRDLERRDFEVSISDDGNMWILVLRADSGLFKKFDKRLAFLRAVPRSEVTAGGGGRWADEYESTNALILHPKSRGYQIAMEDAGFNQQFAEGGSKAADLRIAAGVPTDQPVCVLHDKDDEFAAGAYSALASGVSEAGWRIVDCGVRDVPSAMKSELWQAALIRVPIPESAEDVAALWGSGKLSGFVDPARDALISEMASAPDVYLERDLRVGVEALLVNKALAVPLALDPLVTITDKSVGGVDPRGGRGGYFTYSAGGWAPQS